MSAKHFECGSESNCISLRADRRLIIPARGYVLLGSDFAPVFLDYVFHCSSFRLFGRIRVQGVRCGAQLLRSGSAVGKFGPGRFGAAATVADVVERCGLGVGARLSGAGDIELKVRRNGHVPVTGDGHLGARPA